MQSRLNNRIRLAFIGMFLLVSIYSTANEIPECPENITIKSGTVINANGWSYSFATNFINKDNQKVTMQDGILNSHYKFPEISEINSFTNSVTGGLSYDEIEESDTFLSLTWDIESIYKNSTAVFACEFYGDEEKEVPVRKVYLHKAVPKIFKKCTVSYQLKEYNRVPESQKLACH